MFLCSLVLSTNATGLFFFGRKQVSKRSTHARPGMHMQQCSVFFWGGVSPPPPSGGAKFLEAPKAPKKIFVLNQLAPKVPKTLWPNLLNGEGAGVPSC